MSSSCKTLLVRHLPAELDDDEKTDLLMHFGAKQVKLMGIKGPMKHTAFARFENTIAAEKCLKILHQMEVVGRKLVVEYAKHERDKELELSGHTADKIKQEPVQAIKTDTQREKVQQILTGEDKIYQKHGITYPRKASLLYFYPPPTVASLTNITNALAANPTFYTQVLHLMNKMNLPCPFGALTASPPLALEISGSKNDNRKGVEIDAGEIEEYEMEQSSTEESEIESDPESKKVRALYQQKRTNRTPKRPRKRMRVIEPDVSMVTKQVINVKPAEVFESQENLKSTQIKFNLSETSDLKDTKETDSRVTVVEGGFGKVLPQTKQKEQEEIQKEDINYTIDPKRFLSKDEIKERRLKPGQMKEFSVFKSYSAGEPTCRLYIKNLTKQSTEQDLVDLFGSFINWSSEMARDVFDIRLMREGRMKGQAFVTLPEEESAQLIVTECTGYVMYGKPVVIQFARSAKAKQVKELIQ